MGIFSLVATNTIADNAKKPYWQDVQVVAVNKEYPRSSFMTYDNRNDAMSGKEQVLPAVKRNMEILLRRFLQESSRKHY